MIDRGDIAVGGLSLGFVALCIGIASGMNGSLIAFATTIAGLMGTYFGIQKVIKNDTERSRPQ